jgi:hypothetical protein
MIAIYTNKMTLTDFDSYMLYYQNDMGEMMDISLGGVLFAIPYTELEMLERATTVAEILHPEEQVTQVIIS